MTPEDLVEIELIKRLKYRYARCLDLKLWDEIAGCFTAEAVAAYSGGGYSFEGREAIVGFLRRSMGAETFHSSHKMHHPEIDLTGSHTATGVWALDDVVVMTDFELTIRGCSFYEDEYTKFRRRVAHCTHRIQARVRRDSAACTGRRVASHRELVDHGRPQRAPGRLTTRWRPRPRFTTRSVIP